MKALPDGVSAYARTATFSAQSIRENLREAHRTRESTCARVVVLQGRLRYRVQELEPREFELSPDCRDGSRLLPIPWPVPFTMDETGMMAGRPYSPHPAIAFPSALRAKCRTKSRPRVACASTWSSTADRDGPEIAITFSVRDPSGAGRPALLSRQLALSGSQPQDSSWPGLDDRGHGREIGGLLKADGVGRLKDEELGASAEKAAGIIAKAMAFNAALLGSQRTAPDDDS